MTDVKIDLAKLNSYLKDNNVILSDNIIANINSIFTECDTIGENGEQGADGKLTGNEIPIFQQLVTQKISSITNYLKNFIDAQFTNTDNSNNIPIKTSQIIEEKFGIDCNIELSYSSEDIELYNIKTEEAQGTICIYKSSGKFEINIEEKEQTIHSYLSYESDGSLVKEPYVSIKNMPKLLNSLIGKTPKKIFNNTDEFLNYLINNVNDIAFYSELFDVTYDESEYTLIYNELNTKENRKKIFNDLKTKITNMGNQYEDLVNLLDEKMNLSQLFAIGEFAYIRQNNILNGEKTKMNADGKLFNKSVEQGGEGDCWLLAFLYSASKNKTFTNAYKNNIKNDKHNETYTIKMRDKEYTYTYEQILNAKEFSSGDMDIRVLEMAVRDFYAKEFGENMYNPMAQGGFMQTATLFFGVDNLENIFSVDSIGENLDIYLNLIKSKNCICTTSTKEEDCVAIDSVTGEIVKIDSNHELSLLDADDKYVYIINTQNTTSKLKLDINTFKTKFGFNATDVSLLIDCMNKYNN